MPRAAPQSRVFGRRVVILAIGIASATTIFSFVDAVLLKPLPDQNADRIVRVLERRPDGATSWISTRAYLDWRSDNTVFEQIAAQQQGLVTMTGPTDAVPLRVGRVTARYFDVFGVKPSSGERLPTEKTRQGRNMSSCSGDALWQRQFGADPRIVGATILLDDEACAW